ncbi:autoinducer binding domain-containing protein [Pseudomonas syringae]|uniref:autoinducer binding domain-containing protein n=1 Tax=Pseudomonas syringae TaxID=317 RepID=UPI0009B08156|nr:autoinducer binding domain-containing protein [Pseudomonas syringae]
MCGLTGAARRAKALYTVQPVDDQEGSSVGLGMLEWYSDVMREISAAHEIENLVSILHREAIECGFEHVGLALQAPTPFTRRKTLIMGTYPLEWQERYDEQSYGAIDPVIEHSMAKADVLNWSDVQASCHRRFFAEAAQFGLVHGMTYSALATSRDTHVISFARGRRRVSQIEQLELGVKLRCLSDASRQALARWNLSAVERCVLSDREVEILRWTADGKCVSDIAQILCISDNTVNFHIKKIVGKFGSPNKAHAAAHAVALNLI